MAREALVEDPVSGSGTGIVTPYPTHRGIDFDGAADSYQRAVDLVGNANGQLGIASVWFRIDGGNGTLRRLIGNQNQWFTVEITGGNLFQILGYQTPGGAIGVQLQSANTYLAGSGWHHAVGAWNCATGAGHLWIDNVQDEGIVTAVGPNPIDYTRAGWSVGARQGGALDFFDGALSEVYLNLAAYQDVSVEANRWNWRHPNGQPPSLFADGSAPTGAQPILYVVEVGGAMVNLGSGGAFVAAGAPVLSADSPKDRWVASLNRGQRRRRVYAGG